MKKIISALLSLVIGAGALIVPVGMSVEANAYKEEKINTATGDALLFSERQSAYETTKDVTEFRLYMEAMDKLLPNVQKILLGSDIKIDNAESISSACGSIKVSK